MFDFADDGYEGDTEVYAEAERQHALWARYQVDEAADNELDRKLSALRADLERRRQQEAEAAFVAAVNGQPSIAERVAARFMAWVHGVKGGAGR